MLVGGFDSMTRAPHALRTAARRCRMGDAPMIDVMIHDGLYCSIADAGMGGMSDAENARLGDHARGAGPRSPRARTRRRGAGASGSPRRSCRSADLAHDEGARETSYETLAALPPAFTRDGTITAGNASQVSDGAAAARHRPRADRARGRRWPRSSAARSSPGRTRRCTCGPPRRRAQAARSATGSARATSRCGRSTRRSPASCSRRRRRSRSTSSA